MASSDEIDGRGEVRGKSGFIDLKCGHMAFWSVECLVYNICLDVQQYFYGR